MELFWDPGKRSHVDGKGDLMIGTLSVNGAGGVFFVSMCLCHLMENQQMGCLHYSLCGDTLWPLLVCVVPWDGEKLYDLKF